MDAMKMFDTKLSAYLAAENLMPMCGVNEEAQEAEKLAGELCSSKQRSALVECPDSSDEDQLLLQEQPQLDEQLFKRMSSIKLQMEALTLQPEGTKRMELLQNDLRPIFTVECQLSHELIKAIPRYEMFHIMQFESEKFNSLTQCTRFGQEAERDVKLDLSDDAMNNNDEDQLNFGRIHFTVWWREPGTCLNEMLGMGVLHLKELYEASVLEQCKRIIIQRRKVHLANLYFKISLQIGSAGADETVKEETPATVSTAATTTATEDGSDSDNGGNSSSSSSGNNKLNASDVSLPDEKDGSHAGGNSNGNDNNVQIETTHFIAETSRVRLLRGLIYASEVRQLDLNKDRDYLVCHRFWEDELAVTSACTDNKFNYHEQFAVLNDDAFLRRVEKQYLLLELWRREPSSSGSDGNGNDTTAHMGEIRPMGVVRLPLHQFFIAYRDVAITNHLCKAKLPVVSFDAWAPIIRDSETGTSIGEIRCVLAIGSDEQILALKEIHGYCGESTEQKKISIDKNIFMQRSCIPIGECDPVVSVKSPAPQQTELRSTANLLQFLQRSLTTTQPPNAAPPPPRMPPETAKSCSTEIDISALPPSLLKPIQTSNVKSFRFLLAINRAYGLPRNPGGRGKKSSKRNSSSNKQQRFPPNEAPSTYVTFQADEGYDGPLYKSHEGEVFATNIVEKSTQPQWQQRFRISASVDYLLNPQKRFILKIWKKAATESSQKRQQPTPLDDAIVGFAALDLTVFLRGQYLAGCFNIVDFNGRINGQLEIRSQPLEDLKHLLSTPHQKQLPQTSTSTSTRTSASTSTSGELDESISISGQRNIDNFIDDFDNALGLTHLNLGQAIKRKFTELECISQRLRTRLVDVTGEQLAPAFNPTLLDSWQADQDNNTIKIGEFDKFDEFEHDINTAPGTTPPSSSTSKSSSLPSRSPDLSQLPISAAAPLPDSVDSNTIAQNEQKEHYMIASNYSAAHVTVEPNDSSNAMTPKE